MKKILHTLSQKWPEYILEILVLIIGIYGAFELENWNQSRIERKMEVTYLESLKADLNDQLGAISKQMVFENKCIKATNYLIQNGVKKLARENPDTLIYLVSGLRMRLTFLGVDPTYEDMKSTGILRIISNPILRHQIISFYQELSRLEKVILTNNENHVDHTYSKAIVDQRFMVIEADIEFTSTLDIEKPKGMSPVEEAHIAFTREKLALLENEIKLTNMIKSRATIPSIHLALLSKLTADTKQTLSDIESELKKIKP